eukprot:7147230-Alexandrium_andersonii.AAC.1
MPGQACVCLSRFQAEARRGLAQACSQGLRGCLGSFESRTAHGGATLRAIAARLRLQLAAIPLLLG